MAGRPNRLLQPLEDNTSAGRRWGATPATPMLSKRADLRGEKVSRHGPDYPDSFRFGNCKMRLQRVALVVAHPQLIDPLGATFGSVWPLHQSKPTPTLRPPATGRPPATSSSPRFGTRFLAFSRPASW